MEVRSTRSKLRLVGLAFVAASAALLVIFHAGLLVERLRDQSILQPQIALQWLGSLILLGALAYLRYRRVPLLLGRTALAFWLLVLLLHLIPAVPTSLVTADPLDLFQALPTTWLTMVGILWITAALIALLLGAPRNESSIAKRRRRRNGAHALEAGVRSLLSARPPPLA